MSEPEYRLVVREGLSTLHKHPAGEACNLDDSDSDISVDEFTAAAVIEKGDAVRCQHCWPDAP